MYELIALIILIISLGGIGIIIFRKIPVLVKLPLRSAPLKEGIVFNFKEKIKNIPFLRAFSLEIFLQKFLSKIRILTLKIENKIANYLQKIREKSQQQKSKENDDYWERLKRLTRKK